jgi:hypothetical protein
MPAAETCRPGEVREVVTPRGLLYVQFSTRHRGAWFLRVLPGFYDEPVTAERLKRLVASPSLFTLYVWLLEDVGRVLANEPVPVGERDGVPTRLEGPATERNPLGWSAWMPGDTLMPGHEYIEQHPDVDWERLPTTTPGYAKEALALIGAGGDPFAEPRFEDDFEEGSNLWLDGPTFCCRFDGSRSQASDCYTDLAEPGFAVMEVHAEHLHDEPPQWWVLVVTNGRASEETFVSEVVARHGGKIQGRAAEDVRRVLRLSLRSNVERAGDRLLEHED